MSNKLLKKHKITILFVIIAVTVTLIIVAVYNYLNDIKSHIEVYDSYADVIEDYSFVLGCENIIKCQTTDSGDFSREYVYNLSGENECNAVFQYGIFKKRYKVIKPKILSGGINRYKPFPKATLPNYAGVATEFRHYLSKVQSNVIFEPDNPHDIIALSFNKALTFEEVKDFNKSLDTMGYAVKFCWVDTYLSDEVDSSSRYAMGQPVTKQYLEYEDYLEYETAYGFLLYDHDYPNKETFKSPEQRFVDIISAQHNENYMSEELKAIKDNLEQKGTLNADSLEIIGVTLEKKDGMQFSFDEASKIYDNTGFVNFIYS